MKVTTMRGQVLDVTRYLAQNEDSVAIGNGMMNARGDIIGPGGRVVKKRDEVAAEYHRNNPKAVRKVALRDLDTEVFATPAEAVATVTGKAKEARRAKEEQPVEAATTEAKTRKRKISESDN